LILIVLLAATSATASTLRATFLFPVALSSVWLTPAGHSWCWMTRHAVLVAWQRPVHAAWWRPVAWHRIAGWRIARHRVTWHVSWHRRIPRLPGIAHRRLPVSWHAWRRVAHRHRGVSRRLRPRTRLWSIRRGHLRIAALGHALSICWHRLSIASCAWWKAGPLSRIRIAWLWLLPISCCILCVRRLVPRAAGAALSWETGC